MSRHRHVRNLDLDDLDDDLGRSWTSSEFEPSPDTKAAYLYNYQPTNRREQPPLSEWAANVEREEVGLGHEEVKPVADDAELLATAAAEIRKVLGETFTESEVNSALQLSNYDAEAAVARLLDSKEYPGAAVLESDSVPEQSEGRPSRLVQMLDEDERIWARRSDSAYAPLPSVLETPALSAAREAEENPDAVPMFQFDTPSPDDVVLERQAKGKVRSTLTVPVRRAPAQKPAETVTEKLKNLKMEAPKTISIKPGKATESTEGQDEHQDSESGKSSSKNLKSASTRTPEITPLSVKQRSKTFKLPSREPDGVTLVVAGHVDAGKSTIVGHLLRSLTNARVKREKGREASLSWLADSDPVERERGVTIDVSMHTLVSPKSKKQIVLLDSPGHRDFVPAMIAGASQASSALLIVDASAGEFEAGFSEDGQTREHTMLLRGLGIAHLIIVVNKMDMVDFDRERFEFVKSSMQAFLKQAGFKDSVTFVPCAGLSGVNLVEQPDEGHSLNRWYKGPTLLEEMDRLPKADNSAQVELPTRVAISDVTKNLNFGAVTVTGKIVQGSVASGDRLLLVPNNELATVKAVDAHLPKPIPAATANTDIPVSLGLLGATLDPAQLFAGMLLCDPEHPLPTTSHFAGHLITMPSLSRPLVQGSRVICHCGAWAETATVTRLVRVLGKKQGREGESRPRMLTRNQSAEVEVTLGGGVKVPLEVFARCKALGRFVLRDKGRTLAAGIVTALKG